MIRTRFNHFPEPEERDFDTYEEYEEAHDLWEGAEDAWADEYVEARMTEREMC